MEQDTSKKDGVQTSRKDSIWLDETLSEEGLEDKRNLLDLWWSKIYDFKLLTPDHESAHPKVLKYLRTRIEIITCLQLLDSSEDKNNNVKRKFSIETDKKKVLRLISEDGFINYLKLFGITDDHALSPANLLPKRIAPLSEEHPKAPASVDLAELLPHYTSPWKNAILLALLAEGLKAEYSATARYITTYFAMLVLPEYCAGHGREPLDYMVGLQRDKEGNLKPRYPEINGLFQKDRSRVKRQLELFLERLRDSLASQTVK